MKQTLKSILSISLIIAMVFSLGIINVIAASTTHTATITVADSSGEDLTGAVGDTVVIEVFLDNTLNTMSIGYEISFDKDVFEFATTGIYEDVFNDESWEVPKFTNRSWVDDYLGLSNGKKWGLLTINGNADEGYIVVGGAKTSGTTSSNALTNLKIGSFTLKVKEGAKTGPSDIKLINTETMDGGESVGVPMISNTVTYTVSGGETPDTYTVTFNSNGGSAVAAINDVVSGSKITAPTAPTKTGYDFAGWYKDEALTDDFDFANDTITADITLYAKWTQKSYTVTFNSNGGSTVASTTALHGAKIDAPTAPTKTEYDFAGWYKDEALTVAFDFANDTITSNITLYAKWTAQVPATYTVTFNSNGGSPVAAINNVVSGTKIEAPTAPTKDNSIFAGWYKDEALTSAFNFATDTITSDITLYAKWTEIPAGAAITLTNSVSGSVKVGNKFNVPVTVTGIDSFRAIAFTMSYDTAKLKYKGYVAHENFSTQVVDPAEVAAVNGTAVFAFGASDGDELTGSTVVATLEFEALAATDSTEISLSNVIYAVIPTSDDVNISNITNTTVSIIDNTAPVISGLKITGVPAVGQELTAEYTYSDADNNAESGTTFAWYSADTVDGTYTLISGANTNKLTLTEDLLNKYIKVVVTPNDGITFGIDYSAFTADKVTSIIPGDVHQDGKVQLGDALLVMDYLEGKTILTDSQKIAADISGDGQILAEDVVKILLKAAKAK